VLFHPIILCVGVALGHLFGGRSLQNGPSDGVLTAQVPDGPIFCGVWLGGDPQRQRRASRNPEQAHPQKQLCMSSPLTARITRGDL
jgi:hypothetical protein